MSELKWHPAANIFPMMEDKELQELAEDIREKGQFEPISICDDMILDGRNRSAACLIAGVDPVTIGVNPRDPVAYVLSLNLHRRHLTPSQGSMCAARARAYYDEQARERMNAGAKADPVANLPQGTARARDAAGKAFGVSGKSVDYATKVIEKGIPELAKAVDAGRMAVSTAATVASETPEEQQAAIDRQADRNYANAANRQSVKPSAKSKPRHDGEHNMSEVFALTKADVAITQLKGIPAGNDYRDAALDRVVKWINSQRKVN